MNPTIRATAMLIDPLTQWKLIEQESGDPAFLLSRYVALLGLVPALFGFVGASFIGAEISAANSVRAPIFDGLFGALFGYAESFITVLLLGLIINLLAPLFGGQKDFASAFKLAVYSYTPVWLAGIFLLLPGLRFLVLTGFFGAYILAVGLPRLMKPPQQAAPMYTIAVVICAFVLTYAAADAQRSLFGTAGL
jgi:hypothetical protein